MRTMLLAASIKGLSASGARPAFNFDVTALKPKPASFDASVMPSTAAVIDVVFALGNFWMLSGNGSLAYSPDLISWTPVPNPVSTSVPTRMFVVNDKLFIMAGAAVRRFSSDGINWINSNSPDGYRIVDMTWNGKRYYACTNGRRVYASDDLINWTRMALPGTETPELVSITSDGDHIVTTTETGRTYFSLNNGATWALSVQWNNTNMRLTKLRFVGGKYVGMGAQSSSGAGAQHGMYIAERGAFNSAWRWVGTRIPGIGDVYDVLHDGFKLIIAGSLRLAVTTDFGLNLTTYAYPSGVSFVKNLERSANKLALTTNRGRDFLYAE